MSLADLAEDTIQQAKACGVTLATAESCTGGAVAHLLSQTKGAGDYFHGGFVTYTKGMKIAVLGVSEKLLREKSAVCAEVAEAMVKGALAHSPADVAVAITGVVGPDPDEDGNPVGIVYCAGARRGMAKCVVKKFDLASQPSEAIMQASIEQMLLLLRQLCAGGERGKATG